ncbi:MAG: SGNH/GDSL hydrolase family protein [Pseudolysinimonas sp.]
MTRLPAFLLAPIVLVQARALRRDVPRLPAAEPRSGGSRAAGATRLLVFGDSTAVGTGVEQMTDAVAGQIAKRIDDPVAWRVVGASGLTSQQVREQHLEAAVAEPFDVVVLLVGWNDALRLRSDRDFAGDLSALLDALYAASPAARQVLVLPPRFMDFAVLPQPLRHAVGAHVVGLTRVAVRIGSEHGATIVAGFDGVHVASDRFHPDATGYAEIAERVVSALR